MSKLLLLASLAVGGVWAQDRPALNGVWQLDAAHSAFSELKLKSQTLSIIQEDESIKIAGDRYRGERQGAEDSSTSATPTARNAASR